MKKYAVHYVDKWGHASFIHIFAHDASEAETVVDETGIGFEYGETQFAKQITDVVEVD